MELMTGLLLVAVIIAICLFIYESGKPGKDYPPGPWKVPWVGNAFRLSGPASYTAALEIALEYGPIVGLKMGPLMQMVMLTDVKLVKEAFANPVVTGKPDIETFHLTAGGKYGIVATDGPTWIEQRRFTLRHLRDLGFGKTHMEDLIMEEVNEFIAWLKAEEGLPILLDERIGMAVLNSIWMLLHGHRYSQDDPKLRDFFEKTKEAELAAVKGGILFVVPWLARLFPNASGYNQLKQLFERLRGFFAESIEEHKAIFQDDGPPRDLLEAYLAEMKKQRGTDSSFNEVYGPKNLVAVISDIFGAGQETTSSTLKWLFLYVTRDPKIQEQIHQELDRVIGKSRRPTLGDRPALPYIEATMLETLRISSIVALGAPHELSEDIQFHGYRIPKGHMITPNIWGIHHHPDLWTNPEEFNPSRFISKDGKSIVNTENLIPFSIGRRACVGELMARSELFLFTANIFQRFKIGFDPFSPNPTLERVNGFVLKPKPYKVIMTDRLA